MKQSKVFKLLQHLPKNELNEFDRYLRTDFFNRSETLVAFFQFFYRFLKGRAKLPDKPTVYRKLFPEEHSALSQVSTQEGQKRIRKRTDDLLYELKSHLESYLVWRESQNSGFERDALLLSALQRRRADESYFKTFSRLEKRYRKEEPRPLVHDYFIYLLGLRTHEHPAFQRWKIDQSDIAPVQEDLDRFYIASKLMNAWIQILQDIMLNRPTEILMLDAVLLQAEKPPFRDQFYIDCYRRAIRDALKQDFSLATGKYLRDRVLPSLDQLPPDNQIGMFNLLLNYHLILYQNHREREAHAVRFELMKLGLKKGYLIREGMISYADFYNLVTLAIDFDDLKWGTGFVDKYGPQLREDVRRPTVVLARARLKLAAGKYEATLQLLNQKQEFTSEIDQVLERLLRLKCHYELRDADLLEHLLEASRKHFSRMQAMGELYREYLQHFVRLTRRLFKAWTHPDRNSIAQEVLDELAAGIRPASPEWLEEKARELLD